MTLLPALPVPGGLPAPTVVFQGDHWYTLSAEEIENGLRQRLRSLESAKIGLVFELLEANAVLAAPAPNIEVPVNSVEVDDVTDPAYIPPPANAPERPAPTDLLAHKAVLEANIAEYDLRITALLTVASVGRQ